MTTTTVIALRLPDKFDQFIRSHYVDSAAPELTDEQRRQFIAALLAATVADLGATLIADGLIRLNGGPVIRARDAQVQ